MSEVSFLSLLSPRGWGALQERSEVQLQKKKQGASLTFIESFTVYKALTERLTHLTLPIILWRRTRSIGLPGPVFFPLHSNSEY